MSDQKIIDVQGVSKRFRLKHGHGRTVKAMVLDSIRRTTARDFWALKDVTFSVSKGETLGIIGSNGAGKSTLLALAAGTIIPTEGHMVTNGTISSLLELGAGFHPDLTGRENVYLYGAIMGLSRAHMRARFDAILEFAGIGEFIDQPVKHYSSGMYVRLGFAVAVEVDPDILLIDEVLTVGDADFQQRCLAKMDEFRAQGKTMLVVSHDMTAIQRMSDRILFLDEGTVQGLGNPEDIVSRYTPPDVAVADAKRAPAREWGSGEIRIEGVEFSDGQGNKLEKLTYGGSIVATISYKAEQRIADPVFGISISDIEGRSIFGTNTQLQGITTKPVEGLGSVTVKLDDLALAAGQYLFSFAIHSPFAQVNYHRLDNYFLMQCENPNEVGGCCCFPSEWKLD